MHKHILGIDVGSVSVSIAEISEEKSVLSHDYAFHHGEISRTLMGMLEKIDLSNVSHVATTTSVPGIVQSSAAYDNQVAVIHAAKLFYGEVGAILTVGGEKFGLLEFNEKGDYRSFIKNTSCAAGTGSFLDQQAKRLNLESAEMLSDIAFANSRPFPKIASRCAVFAKTDLIHAQQEGYSFEEISDGLCYGLSKNIVDTLFSKVRVRGDLVFCGGVSKNRAVLKHIADLTGLVPLTDEYSHIYGAIGAGFALVDELQSLDASRYPAMQFRTPGDIVKEMKAEKTYGYDPLTLKLSDYPEFTSLESYDFKVKETICAHSPDDSGESTDFTGAFVETDIYESIEPGNDYELYLGIDIGSTSTKASLVDKSKRVMAGFYTRTAGRPLDAVKMIFETIDNLFTSKGAQLSVVGCGTTGSGRKFIGKIIGSSSIIDEITAHARAAFEINPVVDTIIEIGGQDAKFTTLKNGMVTSSIMNNVCAAGTGSFIEEQARKLNCDISDYAKRAEHVRAPMASDRCTVFMERDLNHLLSEEYSVNEVLASVLHSVRENYLMKVASEANIGDTILFQGATAKNRALVAAFEHRLGKRIYVSRFCHLTGAIGTALILIDEGNETDSFRGLDLYKEEIPIRSEVCELCTNHCKITVADVAGESVAYGFLCGRDYGSHKFVNNNIAGFDLLKERKKSFRVKPFEGESRELTMGIPAGLHLQEDLGMWTSFFSQLGIKTVTSESFTGSVKLGKNLTGAEFCAPITAMHGHVDWLYDRCDFVFVPFYFENKEKEKNTRRQFCYYTQFTPSLISCVDIEKRDRILSPVIKHLYSGFTTKIELYRMLNGLGSHEFSYFDVSRAYDRAVEYNKEALNTLQQRFSEEVAKGDDIKVVFMGRPYTVLNRSMNSGIPEIFASLGIKNFYQDMLGADPSTCKSVLPLMNELHWEYASKIIGAAESLAGMDGVYPVFITSFKCSPDAFIVEYFKKLMEAHKKPYLILELDEHDSSVGYETRIEAGVRAFRNHNLRGETGHVVSYDRINPVYVDSLKGKTVILPNWDPITCRFLTANLRREGIDAILMKETGRSISESLRFNTGECIPINAIAQGLVDCIDEHDLDPEKTVLWNFKSELSCNIKMYPHHIRHLLGSYGEKYSRVGVYVGAISFSEISLRAAKNSYLAFMIGGLLRRVACRIRPYEIVAGETDRVLAKSVKIMNDTFLGGRSKEDAVKDIVSRFEWIEIDETVVKPKVAIFGDMYSRDNDTMNQDLIRFIEAHGGEVITTPYSCFAKMIANTYFRKWFTEGKYKEILSGKALLEAMKHLDKKYYDIFNRIFGEPDEKYDVPPERILSKYGMAIENTGESMDNVLKVFYIKEHHPDVSLFVQASPAFCCASLITEAMQNDIEKNTGIPVVSITYDGTGGNKNECIIPYLTFPRRSEAGREFWNSKKNRN